MSSLKPWTSWALAAAGGYSLAVAAIAALQSGAIQTILGLGPVHPPAVWYALLGAIAIGGSALLIAALDPARYWPLILLLAIAKSGVFAGVLLLVWKGELASRTLALSAFNDLLWVAVLGAVLLAVHEGTLGRKRCGSPEILGLALRTRTNVGISLEELSRLSPILLVFLRQSGCIFCREALADLTKKRKEIEANGTRLVLVHMGTEEQDTRLFAKYGLEHATRVDDPRRTLYRAFGLPRGTFGMFLSPKLWLRSFRAAIPGRNLVGRFTGDVFQMPGAFLLYYGQLVRCYRHQSPADRPDYLELVMGTSYGAEEFRG
jgi:peroxiredoxin